MSPLAEQLWRQARGLFAQLDELEHGEASVIVASLVADVRSWRRRHTTPTTPDHRKETCSADKQSD